MFKIIATMVGFVLFLFLAVCWIVSTVHSFQSRHDAPVDPSRIWLR